MVHLGVSGWKYSEWRGPFYPSGLPQARELAYASRVFNSIELNGSFYSLQRPERYADWYAQTPAHFVFAVKGSRFITHNKKLHDVDTPLANFFASGILRLEEKLGPLVWQLPRTARFDAARLDTFFRTLPPTTGAAAKLARRHDRRVAGRSWLTIARSRRLRHVIEVRHDSFLTPAFASLARRHGIAIAVSDAADWPMVEEITAGFMYVRLHGHEQTYGSSYSGEALARWASRIHAWHTGGQPTDAARISERAVPRRRRDVYVYFDNDMGAHAPSDALALARMMPKRVLGAGF
jgi:uncharacterized protein YecE (DUF72 family)